MNDSLDFATQVIRELLGADMTPVTLFVAYIFAGCGLLLRWYWQYYKKGKPNPNTPQRFSLGFWLRDNLVPKLLGMIITVVVIFIFLRFPQQLAGEALSYPFALGIGLGFDYFMDVLKNMQPHRQAAEQAGIELK